MIVVLDIGKTNKKILVINDKLEVLEKVTGSFNEYEKDGVRFEQPEEIFNWFVENLRELAKSYTIDSISVTTHGASLVCLDESGSIAVPPVAYTTDAGEEFDIEFYGKFGESAALQKETSTARVGSLVNSAKLIYFVQKKYPDEYKKVEKILFYPQYFVYKLTGIAVTEPTYLGCHSYLYDFETATFSRLVKELGIEDKLAPISQTCRNVGTLSDECIKQTGINRNCVVTAGIHDSNSSLLPHILTNDKPFILNSTGTWCVLMSRSGDGKIENNELGKTIFYNVDAFNKPVKTAIFMGGREYEVYSKLIEDVHSRTGLPEYDQEVYDKILQKNEFFFIPSVEVGVGIFPDSKPRVIRDGVEYSLADLLKSSALCSEVFSNYEESFAALNLSLVAQTAFGIEYLSGVKADKLSGMQILIEGGFRKNIPYCRLLAELYDQCEVVTTNLEEATAIGAALQSLLASDLHAMDTSSGDLMISRDRVVPLEGCKLTSYIDAFELLAK